VASVSRIDKIISTFCKRALEKRLYSAKEIYNLIEPTNRSHPISVSVCERKSKRGTEGESVCVGERQTESVQERTSVCVCVCVRERERERERE